MAIENLMSDMVAALGRNSEALDRHSDALEKFKAGATGAKADPKSRTTRGPEDKVQGTAKTAEKPLIEEVREQPREETRDRGRDDERRDDRERDRDRGRDDRRDDRDRDRDRGRDDDRRDDRRDRQEAGSDDGPDSVASVRDAVNKYQDVDGREGEHRRRFLEDAMAYFRKKSVQDMSASERRALLRWIEDDANKKKVDFDKD